MRGNPSNHGKQMKVMTNLVKKGNKVSSSGLFCLTPPHSSMPFHRSTSRPSNIGAKSSRRGYVTLRRREGRGK